MEARPQKAQELRRQIEWTLARAIDPSDVLPMLHRLARIAEDGSDESLFANLHLAELLVERDPWRAALFARRLLVHRPDDDRAWATLAFCQTLLGHYRFAASAYHRALSSAPKNPWYAHNLGHLLDVALNRATDAVGWLKRAYDSASYSGEVAASYAHALARVGRLADARKVLARAIKRSPSREHAALLNWLEEGAPADKDHPLPRPPPAYAAAHRPDEPRQDKPARRTRAPRSRVKVTHARETALTRSPDRTVMALELDAVLARGLSRLPLDARQRTRAKTLARDAATYFGEFSNARSSGALPVVDAIAAAVAYAIVYVHHVPLTQSEVAACFRVSVASLRARFGQLRAHLDLTPGDARYASR